MSGVAFTPGPWKVDEHHDGEIEIVGVNMPRHQRFGVIGEWALAKVGDDCMWDNPNAEARDRANAHLIAAAPDLYEALGDVLALARVKWGNLDADANAVFAKAEAARAKARGES